MKEPIYGSRWSQLAKWWDGAAITNQGEVAAVAKRLVAAKARYQSVEASTGVPWWLIAGIHEREASQRAQGYGPVRHLGRGCDCSSQT